MKKIGILTFHKSINYGAYMQCYALSQRMQRDFPDCKVEVIDYVPSRIQAQHQASLGSFLFGPRKKRFAIRMMAGRMKILLGNPSVLATHQKLVRAFQSDWEKLPLSQKQYYTDDYQTVLADLAQTYDAVVVGSDCVWEFKQALFPNVYFLGDDRIRGKFSYAACSSQMIASQTSKQKMEYVRRALQGYRYLGVRDTATEKLVRAAFPEAVLHHNCDPTVLLDLNALPSTLERVREKLQAAGIDLTRPIIGLMGDDNIGRLIRTLFGNEYQVVAVYANTRYADCYLDDLRPLEWARVFSLFSITFTRFFHGTMLSLKNGTPTITLDPWKMEDETHITKILDFYQRTGLLDHYFLRKQTYTAEDLHRIEQVARGYLAQPDRVQIAAALAQEGQSYESFREAVAQWLAEQK